MKDITFAVIGSGFMGNILAKTASEVPYAKCVGAADIDTRPSARSDSPLWW